MITVYWDLASIGSLHTRTNLHYNSYHPTEHKNSVVKTLLHEAERLCDNDKKRQEKQYIRKVLYNNYYPEQSINIIANKQRNNNVPAVSNDTQQIYIYITLYFFKILLTLSDVFCV